MDIQSFVRITGDPSSEVILNISTITDSFNKSIVTYDVPFARGALIQDMGETVRRIRVECYFLRDKYQSHVELVNLLESNERLELFHPKYGLIYGNVETLDVMHDYKVLTAQVGFVFLEHLRQAVQSKISQNVDEKTKSLQTLAVQEFEQAINGDMKGNLGQYANEVIEKVVDFQLELSSQFTGSASVVQEYIRSVDILISGVQKIANEVTQPVRTFLSFFSLPQTVAGKMQRTFLDLGDRFLVLYENLKSSPSDFLQSLSRAYNSVGQLIENFSISPTERKEQFKKYNLLSHASVSSIGLGEIFEDDQENRNINRSIEISPSFNILGERVNKQETIDVLSVNDIEKGLYEVRKVIQEAITITRDSQLQKNAGTVEVLAMLGLKEIALSLQNHASEIKIEAERVIPIEIKNKEPIQLIALKNGLSYQRIDDIWKLNRGNDFNYQRGIRRMSFIFGEILIYLPASQNQSKKTRSIL